MYTRLANGHATKFIQDRPDLSVITDWLNSSQRKAALSAFHNSVASKKPGRVIQRVSKNVRPAFGAVHLAQWDKVMKAVIAVRMTSARETDVFAMSGDEEKVFSERSVILADLMFVSRAAESNSYINIAANISHHAISRLMEREASTPETIRADVLEILQKARSLRTLLSLGLEHNLTNLKDNTTYDMLVPHGDGALVLRTLRVNAATKSFFPDPMPVFSVRTYLEKSMLGSRELERMAGFRISRDAMVSAEDLRHILAWLKGNAEEMDPRRRLIVEQELCSKSSDVSANGTV
ncbi:hypothetical protein SAMN05444279_11464 [Ruegeria intermedia]|uniref:Uncharacterized protein n=1 Tax=Ruegeria intermedia TaxID=996115 RepID=A0A1M4Y993_9RHOB|nr:hypothetical protein [Ruegeria intermedia]SHF02062.1 hypothetical protein SAMN05444279_11464 [Ruegeria intermedia]